MGDFAATAKNPARRLGKTTYISASLAPFESGTPIAYTIAMPRRPLFACLVLLSLASVPTVGACSIFRGADTVLEIGETALSVSGIALNLLDAMAIGYLDGLGLPTQEELEKAAQGISDLREARNDLEKASDALNRKAYPEAKEELAEAILRMTFVSQWLEGAGVDTSKVTDVLSRARALVKALPA